MNFKKNQSIYMQIAAYICENIMTLQWPEGQKITSVRELAATIEVNPNTVMRTYSHLQEEGVIQNKRGIGYFVSPGASQKIKEMQRKEFIEKELPEFMRKMELLGVDLEELKQLMDQQLTNNKTKS